MGFIGPNEMVEPTRKERELLDRIAELERELALAISEREALCDQARAEERERLLPIISQLLEAHIDGYNLSGDEIDDAYRALGDKP